MKLVCVLPLFFFFLLQNALHGILVTKYQNCQKDFSQPSLYKSVWSNAMLDRFFFSEMKLAELIAQNYNRKIFHKTHKTFSLSILYFLAFGKNGHVLSVCQYHDSTKIDFWKPTFFYFIFTAVRNCLFAHSSLENVLFFISQKPFHINFEKNV